MRVASAVFLGPRTGEFFGKPPPPPRWFSRCNEASGVGKGLLELDYTNPDVGLLIQNFEKGLHDILKRSATGDRDTEKVSKSQVEFLKVVLPLISAGKPILFDLDDTLMATSGTSRFLFPAAELIIRYSAYHQPSLKHGILTSRTADGLTKGLGSFFHVDLEFVNSFANACFGFGAALDNVLSECLIGDQKAQFHALFPDMSNKQALTKLILENSQASPALRVAAANLISEQTGVDFYLLDDHLVDLATTEHRFISRAKKLLPDRVLIIPGWREETGSARILGRFLAQSS